MTINIQSKHIFMVVIAVILAFGWVMRYEYHFADNPQLAYYYRANRYTGEVLLVFPVQKMVHEATAKNVREAEAIRKAEKAGRK